MAMVIGEQPSTQVLQLQPDRELDCNGASKQCRFFAVGNSTIPLVNCDNNVKALLDCNIPSGAKSVQGRRPNLEDCYTVEDNFITLHICSLPREAIIPQALQAQEGAKQLVPNLRNSLLYSSSSELSDVSSTGSDISVEAYNNIGEDIRRISSSYQYAAVFDGHGGSAVSLALAESLHPILKKELEDANASGRNLMTIHNIADGLRNSFLRMNSLLGNEAKTAGSTGVVSLISSDHIIVANCGDSRAVLWRNQQAFKLSRDHKPNHPDEQERVVRAGGKVCNYNGIRVMGLLAMTRAFGDHCLSNFGIIAEPEVTIIERQVDDEFVILASDGLWDVISDMEACALASRCFMRAQERNASRDTAARVAASVLIHVALEKGSSDNITVVVLDLRK